MENTIQQPLKWKWSVTIDKTEEFHGIDVHIKRHGSTRYSISSNNGDMDI